MITFVIAGIRPTKSFESLRSQVERRFDVAYRAASLISSELC